MRMRLTVRQSFKVKVFLVAVMAIGCLSTSLPSHAQDDPSWHQDVPRMILMGGELGGACQAMPMGRGLALLPSHCRPSYGQDQPQNGLAFSSARDYFFASNPSPNGLELRAGQVAKRRHAIGEQVWIQKASGWSRARVESYFGSSYGLISLVGFCPGDSGASVWAFEHGVAVWMAMVVSGAEPRGCSAQAVAVASQAIEWPWAR
jgi:hypothetical protein